MTKQTNFPSLPFKLRNGDDMKVRQWLKDNGCKWRGGQELTEWGCEYKNLFVSLDHTVLQSNQLDMEYFDTHEYPEIDPYSYISPVDDQEARESEEMQLMHDQHTTGETNPYTKPFTSRMKENVTFDVYDVLTAFEVTDPMIAHAIKKLLAPGVRSGNKPYMKDIKEAKWSIEESIKENDK